VHRRGSGLCRPPADSARQRAVVFDHQADREARHRAIDDAWLMFLLHSCHARAAVGALSHSARQVRNKPLRRRRQKAMSNASATDDAQDLVAAGADMHLAGCQDHALRRRDDAIIGEWQTAITNHHTLADLIGHAIARNPAIRVAATAPAVVGPLQVRIPIGIGGGATVQMVPIVAGDEGR